MNDEQSLRELAAELHLGQARRHIFLCTHGDCAPAEAALESWKFLKRRLKELGLVDKIVREPTGGAHRNPTQMAKRLKAVLLNELNALTPVPVDELLERRYRRLRGYGAYEAA